MPDRQLGRDEIIDLLAQVADELAPSSGTYTLLLGGGARLAFDGLRSSTVDLDSLAVIDEAVKAAGLIVATRNGLSASWLNASARAWRPPIDEADCPLLFERGALKVFGAPLSAMFLMKVNAMRAKDRPDLVRIWARRPFPSIEAAQAAYEAAYPDDDDAYLWDEVRRLVDPPA